MCNSQSEEVFLQIMVGRLQIKNKIQHKQSDHFEYQLVRSRRKTVALQVYPDLRVVVRAPMNAPLSFVSAFVDSKKQWVESKLNSFKTKKLQHPPLPPLSYCDGSLHEFLGDKRILVLKKGSPRSMNIVHDQLIMVGASFEAAVVERRLLSWYREQALDIFKQRLIHCYEAMNRHENIRGLGIPFPELKVRKMKSRWGSCSQSAVITLSLELIKKPVICIDYVLIHELCHLIEFNHSPRFYALMAQVMPQWRGIRQQLNQTEVDGHLLGKE